MRRRAFIVRSTPLLAGTALLACADAPALRLGVHAWVGYEPLRMAADLGWLGPQVQLVTGHAASDSLAGLQGGALDAATLTLDEMLTARGRGVPLAAVLVLDESAGADMLVAHPRLASLQALAGARVAVEASAVGELMLLKVLDRAGLRRDQLQVVPMAVDAQVQAWEAGRIDAAITYEPTASRLLHRQARRLFDSRALPETIFDVLAVRRDHLAVRRAAVRAAVRAHLLGLAHLRVNRGDALYRMASQQGVSPADVNAALAGVRLPDLARNRTLLGGERGAIRHPARTLADLMVTSGLLPRRDDLADAFVGDFLPEQEPGE